MSNRLYRKNLQKLLLKEMKMLGMMPMDGMGHMGSLAPDDYQSGGCGDEYEDEPEINSSAMKGTVSREDCCAAILCMLECCDCPATRQVLKEACMRALNGARSI